MVDSHIRQNSARPRATSARRVGPLAVVGGGHSLAQSLPTLREWPGDIWAINSTADWLLDHDIQSVCVSIDPNPFTSRAERKLLATCCAPQDGAEYWEMVDHHPGGVAGGVTTASRAPSLALRLGYTRVVFFGCEGSFPSGAATHVNKDDGLDTLMVVRAAGSDYLTHPELFMQCECLSEVLREFPEFAQEESGGLLRAMTADPGWQVVAVSGALREHLRAENGADVWTTPYELVQKDATQAGASA